MRFKLQHPPLIEAIAEARFVPGDVPPNELSERLHDALKDEFPAADRGIDVELRIEGSGTDLAQTVHQSPRWRFARADKSAVVQLAAHGIIVNHLVPYASWDDYVAVIDRVLRAYSAVSDSRTIQHATLRYLNRIELREGEGIEQLLRLHPVVPDGPIQPDDVFHITFQRSVDAGRLVITLASSPQSSSRTFLLDIAVVRDATNVVDLSGYRSWIESAHTIIDHWFFATLTSSLLQRFAPEQP